jgi:nucleoprotein TPR
VPAAEAAAGTRAALAALQADAARRASLYEAETMAHAEHIRRLNESEAEAEGTRAELVRARDELAAALAAHAAALARAGEERDEQARAVRGAEMAASEARRAEQELRAQLEALAAGVANDAAAAAAAEGAAGGGGAGGGGGGERLGQVIQYLRAEKEIAESRVVGLSLERDRLARERSLADARAAELQAQVDGLVATAAAGLRSREQMDEIHRLRTEQEVYAESNRELRSAKERALGELRALRAAADASAEARNELQQRVKCGLPACLPACLPPPAGRRRPRPACSRPRGGLQPAACPCTC